MGRSGTPMSNAQAAQGTSSSETKSAGRIAPGSCSQLCAVLGDSLHLGPLEVAVRMDKRHLARARNICTNQLREFSDQIGIVDARRYEAQGHAITKVITRRLVRPSAKRPVSC